MRMTRDSEESIRCTASGCSCVCFKPGRVQLRSCERCGHGWVAHALEKLQVQAQQPSSCGPVEVALPGLVFDLSSLVLYGAQALPVRLKILLDRLYSVLTPEQVTHILHTLGWSLGDYVRGYMLQYPGGNVLDHWLMVTPEEELLILKQFLRFGETRPIVELMARQCLAAANHLSDPELIRPPKSCQSGIGTFSKRNGGTPGLFKNTGGDSCLETGVCCFKKNSPADHNDTVHHLENFPGGQSLLLPFHFPSSTLHSLVPSTKDLKLTQCLRKPSGTKLAERQRQEDVRREQEDDPILQPSKCEPALKIKADPDKPNPAQSLRHQIPWFHNDQEPDLHRGIAKEENTSSLSPSLNSSLILTSSSFHSSIYSSSSSPPKISQKLQGSSSYPLNPLPSFSSSFLCPLPTTSFSSPLHPLPSSSSSLRPIPSSLCSLPSPLLVGSRKGRVCCGVCGKSFYDKGTLKIHYNAVHLKIKHRCTVAGCTMVFSSLRSRNRHSANPNPRLHTGASRDAQTHRNAHTDPHTSIHSEIHKDKNACTNIHSTHTRLCKEREINDTPWQQDDDAHTPVRVKLHSLRFGLNSHSNTQHGCQEDMPPQADSPPPFPYTRTRTLSQDNNQNFTLNDSTQPTPPLLPACSASSLGSPPSLEPLVVPVVEKNEQSLLSLHTNHTAPPPLPGRAPITMPSKRGESCTSPLTNQQRRWESGEPVQKKKPRKSSMPVKIERVKLELGGN